ncbi:hypothetical protein ACU5AY_02280 [Rhizobium sp. PAMB 3174]
MDTDPACGDGSQIMTECNAMIFGCEPAGKVPALQSLDCGHTVAIVERRPGAT